MMDYTTEVTNENDRGLCRAAADLHELDGNQVRILFQLKVKNLTHSLQATKNVFGFNLDSRNKIKLYNNLKTF